MERAELSSLLGRRVTAPPRGPVCIADGAPEKFMTAFAEAVAGDADIFLCDPNWSAKERAEVDRLLHSKIENRSAVASAKTEPKTKITRGWLMIPTGGTSGQIRFARHDSATIAAAVRGFAEHFGVRQINAAGVLPLHHVSGFMAWMRCAMTGGSYRPLSWKELESGGLPLLPAQADGWFLSLVPTQLERLMRRPLAVDWLRGFRAVLLGGAAAWPDLIDRALTARLPLAPSYGMTEAAAMVAATRPQEFLAGVRGCGTALPHAQVTIRADGAVQVAGESVFRGYFPEWRSEREMVTADAGWIDEHGVLTITGRRDAVVITGGEKVQPVEVEAVLRDTGEFPEVVVLGVPDPEWGQLLVAAYPMANLPQLKKVAKAMSRQLAPPKRPKIFVPLETWPTNEQGKVNRARVTSLVLAAIQSGSARAPTHSFRRDQS